MSIRIVARRGPHVLDLVDNVAVRAPYLLHVCRAHHAWIDPIEIRRNGRTAWPITNVVQVGEADLGTHHHRLAIRTQWRRCECVQRLRADGGDDSRTLKQLCHLKHVVMPSMPMVPSMLVDIFLMSLFQYASCLREWRLQCREELVGHVAIVTNPAFDALLLLAMALVLIALLLTRVVRPNSHLIAEAKNPATRSCCLEV